ncbi:HigA family addiction module antitoxin [Antarcticirhabdus aurantiaca]|uniref:HigA family addiction module antitoxin n=1 Tax=Antarcticirhabdus aurantiaca TaxID=2606717 RepID=A0ACD4NQ62_9HYPH|nr:HigA family addiction module antitoxin [Antarcticirhabdus aurantiaca]WAJ29002.1 HigA family addiction module antitoxin [Jeongeuplla avenae]
MALMISPPLHPGEYLREELLVPLDLPPERLAEALHVPAAAVHRLLDEESVVTAELALRLSAFFGTSAEFWLNLQQAFDLAVAAERLSSDLATIERFARA